jgi:signal transduction histidine kinase
VDSAARRPPVRLPVFVAEEQADDDRPDWGATRCLLAATATAALVGTPLGLLLGHRPGTGPMASMPWAGLVQAHGQLQLFGWLGFIPLSRMGSRWPPRRPVPSPGAARRSAAYSTGGAAARSGDRAADGRRTPEADAVAVAPGGADRASPPEEALWRLHEVSTHLVEAGERPGLWQEVVDAAVAVAGADMGNMQLLDPQTGALTIVASRGFGRPFLEYFARVGEGLAACGAALQRGERVVVEDVAASPLFGAAARAVVLGAGARAVQSTPLVGRGGAVLGVFSTHYRTPRPLTPRELRLLDMIARQVAGALERRRAEAEREALLARERAARAQAVAARAAAERAQGRVAFLAEAGAALAASLDYESTLRTVARLAVPPLADWCAVDLADADGALRRLAVVHADPARQPAADRLRREYPRIAPDAGHTAARVLRTGTPWVDPHVDPARLAAEARDAAHLALARELGFGAELVAPLVARERVLGVLTLVSETPGRYGDPADLQLAEALARRCALAVDNARLYRLARDAARARDVFLSVAAHELRTPVTAVKGYAQLLERRRRRGTLDAAQLEQGLAALLRDSDRLVGLTADLLDAARLQTGRFALRPAPLDLASLVRRVVALAAERLAAPADAAAAADGARPAARRVRLRCTAVAPCALRADPGRLEQVVDNLLDNAVKYSPDGGPVAVAVRAADGEALLTVRDRGIGLPPGAAAAIFEPFGRAPNAAARRLPGVGVGLYLCRQIVELHGGRIWAASPGEGRGTTLSVWLPRDPAPDTREAHDVRPGSAGRSSP